MNTSTSEMFAYHAILELKNTKTRKELWELFRKQIIKDSTKALDITLFPKQEEIIVSNHPKKIIRAARRTAKSFNTAFITYTLLRFAGMFDYPLHIKFAGPRAEDCRNILEHLHNFLNKCPIPNLPIIYDNWTNASTHKKEIKFSNGTWIKSASCDNPEMNDIRGDAHDFLAVDEYGQIKYKDAFLEAALYSLKDRDPLNLFMVVGTYDVVGIGESFDKLFDLGQDTTNTDIQSWTLKGSDNPYSDKDAANMAKDIVTEEGFLREEMGLGVPRHGRIFKEFDMSTQVKDLPYDPKHPLLIGIDFGFRKPIVEFLQVIGENINVLHELCPKDIRINQLIIEISAILKGKFNNTIPLVIGCDPAGNHENDVVSLNSFEILKGKFPNAQYTRHPQLVSKANQVILLKALTIQNKIFVDPSCEKLVRAFAMATPDITRTGAINSAGWKKEKGLDDPLDALVYCLINYGPTSELIIEPDTLPSAPAQWQVDMAMSRF